MKIIQEQKQSNLAENTAKKQRGRGKPFVKNDPRINKEGRPEGSKNFSTLMDTAVKEIAKVNKITEGEVWQILIKRGYSEAKGGNYPFYKDLLDRYFGKARDVFEGDPNNPLVVQISEIIAKKNDPNPSPKSDSQ